MAEKKMKRWNKGDRVINIAAPVGSTIVAGEIVEHLYPSNVAKVQFDGNPAVVDANTDYLRREPPEKLIGDDHTVGDL